MDKTLEPPRQFADKPVHWRTRNARVEQATVFWADCLSNATTPFKNKVETVKFQTRLCVVCDVSEKIQYM